jgi:hypothetical protein
MFVWIAKHRLVTGAVILYFVGVASHGIITRVWDYYHPLNPTVITNEVTHTREVTVPGPVTTKTVDKLVYITDKTEANKLLALNKQLGAQVELLTETLGTLTAKGSGPVTVTPPPADKPKGDTTYAFKDFRLDFNLLSHPTNPPTYDANYNLHQKFEIESTFGRQKDGTPMTISKLFEVGPGDKKTEIPTTSTAVHADLTVPAWRTGLSIQGGLYVGRSAIDFQSTATGVTSKGGLVGVQWLKKGKTFAAEDSTLSLLTPVAAFNGSTIDIGLFPGSINLGQIPHQPLKDLWLSPYIGTGTQHKVVGFSLTSTF